jgi:hypothetical protein
MAQSLTQLYKNLVLALGIERKARSVRAGAWADLEGEPGPASKIGYPTRSFAGQRPKQLANCHSLNPHTYILYT